MTLEQETRSIRFHSLNTDAITVSFRRLTAFERISMPFEYRVQIIDLARNLDLGSLLGLAFCVELVGDQGPIRFFHGHCAEARFVDLEDGGPVYELVLRPALWFRSRNAFSNITHDKTTDQIVQDVLGVGHVPLVPLRMHFVDPPLKRDYCVQYCESDFDFVSRLMEQEGIHYYFEHERDKHTMVITNIGRAQDRPMEDMLGTLTYFQPGAPGSRPKVHIDEWRRRESVEATDGVHFRDYNYEERQGRIGIGLKMPNNSHGTSLAADPYSFSDQGYYPGGSRTDDGLKRFADFATDAATALRSTRQVSCNATGMIAGKTFTLGNHDDSGEVRGYLIVETRHYIDGLAITAGGSAAPPRVDALCIPETSFFRPPQRTRRPRIIGPQVAIVAADDEAATEEIAVDHLGRVRVNFLWSVYGVRNSNPVHGKKDDTSCWIRVAQIWAGQGWGALFTPRVGQEVVVEFEDGDPDRPLITGSVYNGKYPPPYSLPGQKTKSTIKSNSSKGGNGFNELRFEDKKGAEEFWMHAQNNMNVQINNSRTTNIGNQERRNIKQSRMTVLNKGDDSRLLEEGGITDWLDKGDFTFMAQEGGRDTIMKTSDTLNIKEGDQHIDIDLGSQHVTAKQKIELKVGNSSITIDQKGVTIKGMMIKLEGKFVEVKGSSMVKLQSPGVLMEDGGVVRITGMVMIN